MSESKLPSRPQKTTVFICPPPCDHVWDGPWVRLEGRGESATCSKCGADAVSVYLMRLP
jgi:hypothetical protein